MDLNYTPEEIQQLIKLLQKMLPSDQQDKDTKQTDSFVESKIKTKTRSSKQKLNTKTNAEIELHGTRPLEISMPKLAKRKVKR